MFSFDPWFWRFQPTATWLSCLWAVVAHGGDHVVNEAQMLISW